MARENPALYAEMYRRGVPIAEIAAEFGVQRPAVHRGLRSAGALPPYNSRIPKGPGRPIGGGEPGYTKRKREAESERAAVRRDDYNARMSNVVERDPCPRCGVRRDIGCAHMGRGVIQR